MADTTNIQAPLILTVVAHLSPTFDRGDGISQSNGPGIDREFGQITETETESVGLGGGGVGEEM